MKQIKHEGVKIQRGYARFMEQVLKFTKTGEKIRIFFKKENVAYESNKSPEAKPACRLANDTNVASWSYAACPNISSSLPFENMPLCLLLNLYSVNGERGLGSMDS